MISGAAISMPKPMAGNPDVTMMIQRISTGASGKTEMPDLSLNTRPMRRVHACAIFSAKSCKMNYIKSSRGTYLFDIVKHPTSFFNGIDNRCKIIICQYNI